MSATIISAIQAIQLLSIATQAAINVGIDVRRYEQLRLENPDGNLRPDQVQMLLAESQAAIDRA